MAFPPNISTTNQEFDCQQFVYHYTSRDTALRYILSTSQLRLGLLKNTNDPRENQTWSFGVSGSDSFLGMSDVDRRQFYQQTANTLDESPRFFQDRCKLLCVTMDDPAYSPYGDCFSDAKRGFGHSRMWAQYGESHKGICLIFDKAQLDLAVTIALGSNHTIYKGEVTYTGDVGQQSLAFALRQQDLDESGLEATVKYQRERYFRTFFFTKAIDWSQEFEYRWVAIGGDDAPAYIDISSAVAGVVLGAGFPADYESNVLPLCEALGIPLARISWRNGIPHLNRQYL